MLDFEDKNHRKAKVVRSLLEESKEGRPGLKRPCIILDNVDFFTPKVEDLLLKDLEDRHDLVYFLVAKSSDRLRKTIISRAMEIKFFALEPSLFFEIIWNLPETAGQSEELVNIMANLSGGSISRFQRYMAGNLIELYRLVEQSWGKPKKITEILVNLRKTGNSREARIKAHFLLDFIQAKLFDMTL